MDYYMILGVEKKSSSAEIKKQYSYLFKENQMEQMQTILDIVQ